MTQTVNGQNKTPQKRSRPGQRQQERLLRQERRSRRRRIWIASIVAAVIIAAGITGLVEYQQYTARQTEAANKIRDQHATATANVYATGTAKAEAPPAVTGTPTKMAGGLQYIDIKKGSGAVAKEGSTVAVLYTGWLQSNGKKFDSSYDHGGQPFEVKPLGQAQVIPGWNEGLVGMKAGGTRRLIIPPALGYGAQGSQDGTIPPNATLIFDVTIVSVK